LLITYLVGLAGAGVHHCQSSANGWMFENKPAEQKEQSEDVSGYEDSNNGVTGSD
jgi:hypothetical protein